MLCTHICLNFQYILIYLPLCSALRELWLCNNAIVNVPSQVADLKHLQVLSLANNLLTTISPEICLLGSLTKVYLQGNKLMSLPDLFLRLRRLQELNINNNHFPEFPKVLCQLEQIVSINIEGNELTSLPDEMRNMRSLIHLNVSKNKIEIAPEVLRKVHWCGVIGCPLPSASASSAGEKVAHSWTVSSEDFEELGQFIRNRAAARSDLQARIKAAPGGKLPIKRKTPPVKVTLKKG